MGLAEIRNRLGISRQRVHQLAAGSDFPKPCDVLIMGRVWLEADVERWIRTHRPELM
jgi:predicted DNA-binding transcriptional regulator AlpA